MLADLEDSRYSLYRVSPTSKNQLIDIDQLSFRADNWRRADGTSYTQPHVSYVVKCWETFHNLSYEDRPRWNEAYNSPEGRNPGIKPLGALSCRPSPFPLGRHLWGSHPRPDPLKVALSQSPF